MDQDYGLRELCASVDVAVIGRKTRNKIQELMPGKAYYHDSKNCVFTSTRPSGIRDGVEYVSNSVESRAARIRSEAV